MSIIIKKPENIITKENSRILLLRQDRIGDVLISTPFFRNLRNQYPKAEIDILLGKNNLGTWKGISHFFNNYFIYDKKLLSTLRVLFRLRRRHYDVVVDLMDKRSKTSELLIKLIKPKISVGTRKSDDDVYTYSVEPLARYKYHIVERTARLLLAFGVDPTVVDLSLEFKISDEDISNAQKKLPVKSKPVRLGINLSGSNNTKYWGTENHQEFLYEVLKIYPDVEIIILITKNTINEAKAYESLIGITAIMPVHSLNIYAAMLSTCDIILTPDTAAVHFATAWKIPCIAIYEISDSTNLGHPWTPYNSPCRILTTDTGMLPNIKPEEVLKAFNELMVLMKSYN